MKLLLSIDLHVYYMDVIDKTQIDQVSDIAEICAPGC